MAAELKPYPDYKDSGVEWLGAVPTHWEVRRLKSWLGVNELVLSEDTDPEYALNYLDIGSVETGRLTSRPPRIRFGNSPSRARRIIRSGDTIVSTVRTYLKAVWHAEHSCADLIASTGFAVLTPRRGTVPRFVGYVCQSDPFTNRVTAGSVGIAYPAIAETRLATFDVCVPPIPEQAAIVRFLDHADRRIRRYIRAKQKLIALLEEQKQAFIHQAVTGQIDVRTGQPYPAYMPSGVEWLGDVPEHWRLPRLGALLRERGETNGDEQVIEVLSVLRERGVVPYAEKGNVGNKKSEDITRYKVVRPDDIVVNCMNVIIGSVGLSRYTGCLSPVYYVLTRRSERDHPRYLDAYFHTKPFQESLVRIGNGILAHRMRIPMELLKCEPFPRPPFEEQAAIVSFVDRTTAALDAATASAQRETSLLREYHTRLIADVVTGKLDVREAAARLPDEVGLETPGEADALIDDAEEPSDDLDAVPKEAEV